MQSDQIPAKPKILTAADNVSGWRGLVVEELAKLNGVLHSRKKKDTLLAIIDARLTSTSEESVWGRGETCNRSTWHEKWKKEPLIAEVLENCWRVADRWKDTRAADALTEAMMMLQLESPNSVRTMVHLRDMSDDDRVRLQASTGILDRADVKTAAKGSSTTTHKVDEEVALMIEKVYGDDGDDEAD